MNMDTTALIGQAVESLERLSAMLMEKIENAAPMTGYAGRHAQIHSHMLRDVGRLIAELKAIDEKLRQVPLPGEEASLTRRCINCGDD